MKAVQRNINSSFLCYIYSFPRKEECILVLNLQLLYFGVWVCSPVLSYTWWWNQRTKQQLTANPHITTQYTTQFLPSKCKWDTEDQISSFPWYAILSLACCFKRGCVFVFLNLLLISWSVNLSVYVKMSLLGEHYIGK